MVVSIWWLWLAFLAGAYAGAILVSLMTISRRGEDDADRMETEEEEDVRLVA